MFMTKDAELIPVHKDPDVQAATERLTAARQTLESLEADERRMVRLVMGREDMYTDHDIEEAHRKLAIRKGTQTGWYLPEADTAREEARLAEHAHRVASRAAQERLTAAGEAQLIQLVTQLDHALSPVRALAKKIEVLRQEMNEGGVRPPDHPAASLLPGALLDFQMRNCRTRGWI